MSFRLRNTEVVVAQNDCDRCSARGIFFRCPDGFDEAVWRAEAFADAGADLTFLEAPENESQMEQYCHRVPRWKVANALACE